MSDIEETTGSVVEEQQREFIRLKSRRATAKAAVTRTITAMDKLMAVDTNLTAVKDRMVELDHFMAEFTAAKYADHLTEDHELKEAAVYWQKAVTPANDFCDAVGAWIAELEGEDHDTDVVNDEQTHEQSQHVELQQDQLQQDQLQHEQTPHEQPQPEKIDFEAKIQAVKDQQALELEAFQLESQALKEQLKLERQRFRLRMELEKQYEDMGKEIELMKADLARLKLTARTEEDTPSDLRCGTKVAKADVRFTHSTPK